MVDVLNAYLVSTKTVLSVSRSICALDLVGPIEKDVAYVHLKEQPFELSDEVEYYTKVVTAHKLSQYQNRIHTIRLEEDVETWLDILIMSDIADRKGILKV